MDSRHLDKTRRAIVLAALALISRPRVARAQVARRYRVAYFELQHPGAIPPKGIWGGVLERELGLLGFSDKNTSFEYVLVEWDSRERLPEKARELVATAPDVIFSEYPNFVAEVTTTIPIVFANRTEEMAIPLVGDLRRPRANVTGVVTKYGEHRFKRLEVTRELLPKARRLAFIYNGGPAWQDPKLRKKEEGSRPKGPTIDEVAKRLGFELIEGDVAKHGEDLDATLESVRKQGAEIIFPMGSASIRDKDRYAKFSRFQVDHRIAYIGDGGSSPGIGPVLSWGMDWKDHYRRAAEMIAQILKGKRPSDIAVDVTSRFLITVDKRAAAAMNLEIPASILVRADRIIQ